MAYTTTWQPWVGDGAPPAYVYAFPRLMIDPLTDALCVRSALEHFHTVAGATDEDRLVAFGNIKRAAEFFHLEVDGDTYEQMCSRPQVEVIPRD